MATQNQGAIQVYSLNQGGIVKVPPLGITSLRNPTSADFAQPFTPWRNISNPAVPVLWFFAGSNAGGAIWQQMEAGSGAGVFSSLVVNPGPTSLTGVLTQSGTANINTAGAAVTSIGVGGTGAVHIGNATGNTNIAAGNFTVTLGNISAAAGSISADTTITAGTDISATTGDITAAAGNIVATIGSISGESLYSGGDLGGVAANNALTNVVATAAGGGTVTFGANGAGNIVQTGWMKLYAGVTAVYVPYFSAI